MHVWQRLNATLTRFLMRASPLVLTLLPYCLPDGERKRIKPSQAGTRLKSQLFELNKGARRDGALDSDPTHILSLPSGPLLGAA